MAGWFQKLRMWLRGEQNTPPPQVPTRRTQPRASPLPAPHRLHPQSLPRWQKNASATRKPRPSRPRNCPLLVPCKAGSWISASASTSEQAAARLPLAIPIGIATTVWSLPPGQRVSQNISFQPVSTNQPKPRLCTLSTECSRLQTLSSGWWTPSRADQANLTPRSTLQSSSPWCSCILLPGIKIITPTITAPGSHAGG